MSSKILLRRGTAAQWSSSNPILGVGELGIETDTLKIKIGNGTSTWTQLTSYANVTPSQLTSEINNLINAAPSTLDTLNELAAAINNDASFSTTVNNLLTGKVSKSGGDTITASTASTVGLVIQGAASQTANLQQWKNSAGTTLGNFDKNGILTVIDFSAGAVNATWRVYATAGNSTITPMVAIGAVSQTADLQVWQNSAGTVLAKVSANGSLTVGNTTGTIQVTSSGTSGTYPSSGAGIELVAGSSSGTDLIQAYNRGTSAWRNLEVRSGKTSFLSQFASSTVLTVKGFASQTANLQEWQNSDGTTMLYVSPDGTLNKTGTLNIGPILQFADPGVGYETKFIFQKSTDGAFLIVKERASDQTFYEFGMNDNAMDGGDYFQWTMGQWTAPGMGWAPIQIGSNSGKQETLRFTGDQSLFWSNLSTPVNTPFFTTIYSDYYNADYAVTKWTPSNDLNINVKRFESNSGSSATFNIDISGYTSTVKMGYKVTIDPGATTFSYSTYQGDNSSATGVAITAGSWQTLSNGVKIKIGAGALASEYWSFVAFPTPRTAIGGLIDTSALAIIRPTAVDKGLIIKSAISQTANLQEWQASDGVPFAWVTPYGNMVSNFHNGNYYVSTYNTGSYLQMDGYSVYNFQRITTSPNFIVKAAASQTADLQQWQNSAGTTIAKVDSSGNITAADYKLSNSLYNIKKTLKKTIDPAQNAIAGNTYDLFQIGFATSLQGIFTMQVSIRNGGYGQSMSYTLPATYRMDWLNQYGITNPFTDSTTWVDLTPITFAPRHLMTNDYLKFQARIDNNTIYFRIKLTGQLTSNPLFDVYIQHSEEFANSTVTELSSTGTDFTTSGVLPNFLSSKAGTTAIFNPLTITSSVAATVPLVIKSATSQTANLQEWQNSTGTVGAYIAANGNASIGGVALTSSSVYIPSGNLLATTYVTGPNNSGGAYATFDNSVVKIEQRNSSAAALIVKGAASQTGNLQEWQNSSGTVIANIDPSGILHVNNNINSTLTTAIIMNNSGVGTGTGTQIVFQYGGVNYASISSIYSSSPAGADMVFNVGSTSLAKMRIDANGNVGINQLLPGQKLDVVGAGRFTAGAYAANQGVTHLEFVTGSPSSGFTHRIVGNTDSAGTPRLSFQAATNATGGSSEVLSIRNDVGSVYVTPYSLSSVGLIIKGAASQTASLQEWQDSTGTLLGRFHPTAGLLIGGVSNINGGGAPYMNFGTTNFSLYSNTASNIGLIIKGAASQTANLQEWQDSSGTILSSITSDGTFKFKNSVWHKSTTDSQDRVYYEPYSSSYYKSANAHYFRNSADTTFLTINNVGNILVNGFTASTVGLSVKGAASQTANLQEWQDSAGSIKAYVDSTGRFLSTRPFRTDDVITAGSQASTLGQISAISSGAGRISIVAQGAASQTANLQEWQNSAGTVLAYVISDGSFVTRGALIGGQYSGTAIFGVQGYSASNVVAIVKGVASQTANLQEWQDSTGSIQANVNNVGIFNSNNATGYQIAAATYYGTLNGGQTARIQAGGSVGANPHLVVRQSSGATGNLQEWQDVGGTVLAKITASGALDATAITVNGAELITSPTATVVLTKNEIVGLGSIADYSPTTISFFTSNKPAVIAALNTIPNNSYVTYTDSVYALSSNFIKTGLAFDNGSNEVILPISNKGGDGSFYSDANSIPIFTATGSSGKYLTNNGSTTSWTSIPELSDMEIMNIMGAY